MLRILLPVPAVFAACTPSPRDAAMRTSSPVPGTTAPASGDTGPASGDTGAGDRKSLAPSPAGQDPGDRAQAIQGPIQEAVSAAENPGHAMPDDLSTVTAGRRTLSTAFVRIGPDGHLTVELHDGRVLVLRDIVMRAGEYCGAQVQGGSPGKRYCGRYADVAAARPGGAPVPDKSVPAASNPTVSSPGTNS